MKESWEKIYSSHFEHKAEIAKAILEDAGIQSVVVSKKDSAYLFGELELYVHPDNVIRAIQILNER